MWINGFYSYLQRIAHFYHSKQKTWRIIFKTWNIIHITNWTYVWQFRMWDVVSCIVYSLQDNNEQEHGVLIFDKKPIYEICYDGMKQIKSNYHVNDCGQLKTHSVVIQCLNGLKKQLLPILILNLNSIRFVSYNLTPAWKELLKGK